ncbi:MAG: hypothetical protein E5X73_21315 [Mesorhizobium sp.]|nr:MAG: hypothetical protein E5X73_21315 [Mesorhizobium sp.]
MSAFIVKRPGMHTSLGGISVTIYFRRSLLLEAASLLRRDGPAFFRHLSLSTAESELRDFVQDHFWRIGQSMILKRTDRSLLDHVTAEDVDYLAIQLAQSPLFAPTSIPTLYPIVPIAVEEAFEGQTFCVVSPDALVEGAALPEAWREAVVSHQFPPFADWDGRKESPTSWLLVRVPHMGTGRKLSAAILGSLALTVSAPYRYQFTGRKVFGGSCQLKVGTYSLRFHNSLTPALSENIILKRADRDWLSVLDGKISSNADADIRQIKALQYYYRAWFLDEAERFPINCMALDSLLGADGAATESVMTGARTLLGEEVEWERLSLLMRLRGSVMHGGAPDVYESSKYSKYYAKYGTDPITDMDAVVTECLRRSIFGASFVEQTDPYADIVEQQRELGRIPPAGSGKTILG